MGRTLVRNALLCYTVINRENHFGRIGGTADIMDKYDHNAHSVFLLCHHLILVVACNWTDRDQPCSLFDRADGIEIISNYDLHRMGILQPYEARVVLITLDA